MEVMNKSSDRLHRSQEYLIPARIMDNFCLLPCYTDSVYFRKITDSV